MTKRTATIERKTNETDVRCTLCLDGEGKADVSTGIGFLDHLLSSWAKHARFDLTLRCDGDLPVDDHHSAEDCGLALGEAFSNALGDKRGIGRFGYAYAPLDEALSRAVLDISGRPFARIELHLQREAIGGLACENIGHVMGSMASSGRFTLHVDVLHGENDHHRAESAFKALALACRQAAARDGSDEIPSTKGVLV